MSQRLRPLVVLVYVVICRRPTLPSSCFRPPPFPLPQQDPFSQMAYYWHPSEADLASLRAAGKISQKRVQGEDPEYGRVYWFEHAMRTATGRLREADKLYVPHEDGKVKWGQKVLERVPEVAVWEIVRRTDYRFGDSGRELPPPELMWNVAVEASAMARCPAFIEMVLGRSGSP